MRPDSTSAPDASRMSAKSARARTSGPERMFASRRSAPRRNRRGRLAQPHAIAQSVGARVVPRGDQRLWIDVEAARAPGAEPQRRQRQHAGAAAEIDHRRHRRAGAHRAIPGRAPWSGWVPVPKASPGSIRTTAASGSSTCSWCGHTHSRSPKRMAWKSRSHSRSQARSATSRSAQPARIDAERAAPAPPTTRAASASAAEQSRASAPPATAGTRPAPARAPATASRSSASTSVTASAPHARQAASASSAASRPRSQLTSRKACAKYAHLSPRRLSR